MRPPPIRLLAPFLFATFAFGFVCVAAPPASAAEDEQALRPAALRADEPPAAAPVSEPAAQEQPGAYVSRLPEIQALRQELRARAIAATAPAHFDRLFDDVVVALGNGGAWLREALASQAAATEVDALAGEVKALNELRIEILHSTSVEKRERLLGLSREGIHQLLREIQHLGLVADWYPRGRLREVQRVPAYLEDVVTVGSLTWTLLRILFVSLVALQVHRRHRSWLQALRQWLLSGTRDRRLRLSLARAIGHLAGVGGEVVVVAWLLAIRNLAGPDLPRELQVVGAIMIAWAWYRLGRAVLYRLIASAAVRAADLDAEQRARVLRSLDLVGRYVLGVVIFLVLSSSILGRGYLHTVVENFAWIGAIPIGVALVRGWQTEISGAWIAEHPDGVLTGWLERTRDKRRGVVPALVAVGSVVARGGGRWLRDTALRFDQTRSALAYLFRRRLERHADAVGHGVSEPGTLPAALRDAFSEEPLPALAIHNWPRLDEIAALALALGEGGAGGRVALVGERGAGKSSWLQALAGRTGALPVVRHGFAARITEPGELRLALAVALDVEADDEETLVRELRAGPPRLVLLDGCEHLILRSVGGLAAAETLLRIAGRTSDRVLWVCSFARHAYDHLRNLHPGAALFRDVVQLGPWSEAQLGLLIDRRMKAAGCMPVWDDLLIERLDGGTLETEVLRTSERYRRLLWDHAGGNPRVALYFWLRSLVPDGPGRVRVRLFEAPAPGPLEKLEDEGRFLLASVVLHGSLTAAEAARTLRQPLTDCEIRLAALEREGWLAADGDRFAPTTRWYRQVLRHLRRKHMLAA